MRVVLAATGVLAYLGPRTRAVLIWLGLIAVVYFGWMVAAWRSPTLFPLDVVPTYIAARVWASGHPEAIYHPSIWLVAGAIHPEWLAEAAKHAMPMPNTSFVYGPTYLALVRPLATSLSLERFLQVVTLLSAGAGLILGYQSTCSIPRMPDWGRWLVATAVSLSFPAAYTAYLGQNGLIAACLVLVGFRCSEDQRWRWFGVVLLVAACAFKHWCVLLLFVLLLAREWQLFVAALGGYGLCIWGLPKLLMPEAMLQGNLMVLEKLPKVSLVAFNDASVRSLIRRLQWPEWPEASRVWNSATQVQGREYIVEVALSLLVAGLFVWLAWTKRPPLMELGACAMAVVLWPLGICWSHYFVFALPMVVLVIADQTAPPWVRVIGCATALWLSELMALCAPAPEDLHPSWAWAWVISAPLLLSVLVALSWLVTRRVVHTREGGMAAARGERALVLPGADDRR